MASTRVKKVIRELVSEIEKVIGTAVLEVRAELVEATPVDFGWARANWVITTGAPQPAAVGSPTSPGTGDMGAAFALGYKLARGTIFITNNVPYITALNGGSSKQAPAAFVQRAIAVGLKSAGLIR